MIRERRGGGGEEEREERGDLKKWKETAQETEIQTNRYTFEGLKLPSCNQRFFDATVPSNKYLS